MRARKYKKGRHSKEAEIFRIEFNACAYAAFAYVAETADEEDAEAAAQLMDIFLDAWLDEPVELNL